MSIYILDCSEYEWRKGQGIWVVEGTNPISFRPAKKSMYE
jgi:hypothetical protein